MNKKVTSFGVHFICVALVGILCGPMFGALLIVSLVAGPSIKFSHLSDKLVMGFVSLLITSIAVAAVLDCLPGMVGYKRVALVIAISFGLQWGWGRLTTPKLRDTPRAIDTSKGLRQHVLLVVPIAILFSGVGIKVSDRRLFRAISMSGDGRNHAVWVLDLANHGIRSAIDRKYPALFNYALTPFVDACHGRAENAGCIADQARQAVDAMSASYFLLAALISLAIGKLSLRLLHRGEVRNIGLRDALVVIGSALTPLLGVASQSILFDGFLPLYAAIAAVLLAASLLNRDQVENHTVLICMTTWISSVLVLGMFPLLYPAAAAIAFIAMVPEKGFAVRQKKSLVTIVAAACITLFPAIMSLSNSQIFERLRSSGSSTNINRAVFAAPAAILLMFALFAKRVDRRPSLIHLSVFCGLVFSAVVVLGANHGSAEATPYYYDKVLIAGISLFAWLPIVGAGALLAGASNRFSFMQTIWGRVFACFTILSAIALTYVRTEGSSNQLSPVRTLYLGAFSPHPYSMDAILSEWKTGKTYVFWRFSFAQDGGFDPVEDRMLNFWAPLTWRSDTENGAFANAWAYSMSAEYTDEYLCNIARQVNNLRIITRDELLAQDFSETCLNNNDQIELRDFSSAAS